MINISEDAFQIARYLYENKHITGRNLVKRGVVREALSKHISDFDTALSYLAAREYIKKVTGGGDQGLVYLLANGISYVEKSIKERIEIEQDGELLLKYLVKELDRNIPFGIADIIMNTFGWDKNRYTQIAQILADEGYITGSYADGNTYFQIKLLPEGRQIVRNNFRQPNPIKEPTIITGNVTANISGSNNILSIGSILSEAHQTIQANNRIEDSQKEEIIVLLDQLLNLLQELPADKADDGEAVAELAKDLVNKSTKEKPNKRLIEITSEGLKKAAQNIADIAPKVLFTAYSLIEFINKVTNP